MTALVDISVSALFHRIRTHRVHGSVCIKYEHI